MTSTYIKYFTPNTFRKQDFVQILKTQCNVNAIAVDDGIIFDYEALISIPCKLLPHWVWLNREDMCSKWHTRPATQEEVCQIECKRHYAYSLIAYYRQTEDTHVLFSSNNLMQMVEDAKEWLYDINATCYDRVAPQVWIIDNATGEIVERL